MDSETEFPVPNRMESELIKEYFETESRFIAVRSYYQIYQNVLIRKDAVSIIARVSRRIDSDTYIPYLAMNYFDRLCSRNTNIMKDKDVEGRSAEERFRLIAMGCLTISAKMRTKNFSVDQLLSAMKSRKGNITHQMVKKVENLILDELNWKMLPVTAFCFLNHYYPYFKEFGGFRRRCINEIIVQAQGEHTFIRYTPSQIALSAFMAASKIAYPSKYDKIQNPSNFHKIDNEELVKKCSDQMVDLCDRWNIHIEPAESGIGSPCNKVILLGPPEETKEVGTSKVKEIQQRNSMAVVGDSSKSNAAVVNSCEEEEKQNGTAIINGFGTSNAKEIQQGNGKVGSSEEKEKENGTAIINGLGTSNAKEIQQGNGKVSVVGSSEEKEKENGAAIINGVGTSNVKEIQQGNGKVSVVGSSEEKEKENGAAIINGVGTSNVKEIQQGNGKVGSSEEKEKENGAAIINGVGTSNVKEIQQGNGKVGSSEEKENGAAIINGVRTSNVKEIQQGNGKVGSSEEKENGAAIINGVGTSNVKKIQQGNGKVGSSKENGIAINNGVGTSKVKEIQQGNGKVAVVGSSEEKEKENGTAINNGVGTSKVMEIQHSKSKGVVVDLCEEEDEDEEVGTALIQRRQVMRNTDPSHAQVRMQVDVIQLPKDDKDRVEDIIRRSLEKCMAVEAEEPQIQMRGSSSGIVDLVEPLNFKLKWFI
ncbi:uncharacterized protein LOC127086423 isoform X1 [Lathyrus oleraceus]|uniref:B-like cyclin n=1 Tax=Pisum sativum TaxID=3888 RepID=A0A9D4WZM8_PEA|nr:uncharacterized protein LOC127086423 isoform X1 [Pisum sativum]KAI5412049.1 hypothetical protein KIW84_056938 [Pisum sativum]